MPDVTYRAAAMREGHQAQLARLRGEPVPACPYRADSRRHFWWHHGADRIAPMVDRILELGR